MKKIFFLTLFAFPIFSDELWERAVEHLEKTKSYIPAKTKIENIIKSINGEIKSQFSITYETKIDAEGNIKLEPVKVIRDGKDITKEYINDLKKREEKNKEKDEKQEISISTSDYDIFNKKNIEKIKYWKNGSEKIAEKEYEIFGFLLKIDEKSKEEGLSWIETESGKPLKVEFEVKPLPKYTKEMKTILYYGEENENLFLKKMEINGLGSLLFYKRKFKISMEFSNFFEYTKNKQ